MYKNKKYKILYLNPHPKYVKGGPNTFIKNIVNILSKQESNEIYWVSGYSNLRFLSKSKILIHIRIIFLLFFYSPDIVHIHGSLAYLLPVTLFKKLFILKNVRLFFTFHTQPNLFNVDIFSGDFYDLKNKEYSDFDIKIINILLSQCEKIITVSSSITDNFKNKYGFKLKQPLVIPSGTDCFKKKEPNLCLKKYKQTINILSVGVMHYDWKVVGFPLLIETIAKLRNQRREIDFKLILIGDGFYFKNIKDYVHKNEFESFVSLLGAKSNVEDYYKNSDIYCQLSVNEGCSHAILEAMSHSIPVVAADFAGNKKIITNYKTGLLVKNKIEFVAKAILYLIDNPNLVNEICNEAFLNIKERHTWKVLAKKHADLYY